MRNDRDTAEYEPRGYPAGSPPPDQPVYGEPYAGSVYPPVPEKRSNKGIIRLIIFLVIISAALIFLQTFLFRLNTVYVIGNHSIAAEHIVALSGLERGVSILSVSEDKVRSRLEADQWIVLNHLYKQYPNEVYLFIEERQIVATLQWLGIQYTLDIDGMVLEEYSGMNYSGNIPTVYGFNIANAVVGKRLSVRPNEQLTAYSSIVSELTIQRYADRIASINVSDTDQLSMLMKNGITVQLGNSDYMRAKIGAMRTDIAYLQQLGETKGVLDVSVPEDGKFRRE